MSRATSRTAREETGLTEVRRASGTQPKVSVPPASGVRRACVLDLPKLYDDFDDTEASVTTNLVAGKCGIAHPRLVVIEGSAMGKVLSLDPQYELMVGRSNGANIQLDDSSVSRRHCRIGPSSDGFIVEDLGSSNGTFVNGRRLQPAERRRLRAYDRIQFGERSVVQFRLLDDVEDTLARRLYDSAMRDALTQVYNRRHFDQRLSVEISYSTRHATPVSVLMLDIDHFKRVNDEHGHTAGDAVLVAVAAEIAQCVRTEDVVARLGGEEFALILSSDTTAASLLAERIRQRIEALTVDVGDRSLRVTVSIGVASGACVQPGEGSLGEALVACADRRLYRAKQLGRNGVCKAD